MKTLAALIGTMVPATVFAAANVPAGNDGVFVWIFLGFFALVVVGQIVPAALLTTYYISPTNRAMGTLFGFWVVILIIVTFLAAVSRCPRCGNYFHMHGMTFLVLRKCLHCQLHINSDKIT